MKKCVLVLIGALLLGSAANAQYRINKTKYDYRAYTYRLGDPYNPSVAGLTSFFIPGLGQMISGEGRRGVAFLVPYVGAVITMYAGSYSSTLDIESGGDGTTGATVALIGSLAVIGIDIWAIVDAVRVAKVNNLAFRAQSRPPFTFHLQPYINVESYRHTSKIPVGLSMRVNF